MNERKKKKAQQYDLQERLIDFSIKIISVVERLPNTRVGNHIANQLIKSGTSPAANYGEAQSSESRNDFIHKMRLALKELRETRVWLLITERKALIKPVEYLSSVLGENNELISIFVTSIATARKKK